LKKDYNFRKKVFIFGGCDNIPTSEAEMEDLITFDTETMNWSRPTTTGTKPGPHRAHTSTYVENRLFVFGGGDGGTYFDHLFMLDTTNMHWTKPETFGVLPGPRRAHAAISLGKKIFIFGGGDGNKALNDVIVFDSEKLSWEVFKTSGTPPPPRGYHTSTLFADKMWTYGGSDGQDCFSDLHSLDIQTGVWTKKKISNPSACFAHSACLLGSNLAIFGGHGLNTYSNDLKLLNLDPRVETADLISKPFTGELPSPRGYHDAVLCDSRLFIFGGYDGKKCYEDVNMVDLGIYSCL